jgi:Domain of Unknown Function (DUF1259)
MKFNLLQLGLAVLLSAQQPGDAFAIADDRWQPRVGEALGKSGSEAPSGIYRVDLPRTDLKPTLDGFELNPSLALTGWLAFARRPNKGMVMGEFVLTEGEVNPVITRLAAAGIEVTSLHNNLPRLQPVTMFVNVLGHGNPEELALAIRTALAESKTPLSTAPAPRAAGPPPLILDMASIDQILGSKGTNIGGVYQFTLRRAESISINGIDVVPMMGSAIVINFQPISSDQAAVSGHLALISSEVNPVLRALCEYGIEVTAIHNYLLDDQPHLYFMDFWGKDDVKKLARGLKAAIAQINITKS